MRYFAMFILLVFLALAAFFFWRPFLHRQETGERAQVNIKGVTLLVEVARDPAAQSRGLSGRESIPEFGGILFLFDTPGDYEIWMKDMKIPIDILWLRNGRVVDLEERVPPAPAGSDEANIPLYRPDARADTVLEVRSGFASRFAVRIGDAVSINIMAGARKSEEQRSFIANATQEEKTDKPLDPEKYFIETQRNRPRRGGDFSIGRMISEAGSHRKYEMTFSSDGELFSGTISVPRDKSSNEGFPLIIIIGRGINETARDAEFRDLAPEADFFARHGYVAITPHFGGVDKLPSGLQASFDFYARYSEAVIDLLDALEKARPQMIDSQSIGAWGYSEGGAVAARVAVLASEIRAYVLFAPASADVENNLNGLSDEVVAEIRQQYGPAGSDAYKKMSPLNYFADFGAPVQLHHGTADEKSPVRLSEKMHDALLRGGRTSEFFKYPNEGHDFTKTWAFAMERALQFFDQYVKGAQ